MFRSEDPTDIENANQLMKLLDPKEKEELTKKDLLTFVPMLFIMEESVEGSIAPWGYYGRLGAIEMIKKYVPAQRDAAAKLEGLIKSMDGDEPFGKEFAKKFTAMDAFWKPEQSGEVGTFPISQSGEAYKSHASPPKIAS